MFVRLSGVDHIGGDFPQGQVFMVADGVGGREGGSLASAVAVETMAAQVLGTLPWMSLTDEHAEVSDAVEAAMHATQARLRSEARRQDVDPRLGTTLTVAWVVWPSLLLAHVGDSRAYLCRGDELDRLTRDHTVAQALLDAGGELDPRLVEAKWGHVLDNVLGGSSDDLQVDLQRLELEQGDRLLLCTDGLTAYLDDDELRWWLLRRGALDEIATRMAETAYERGGHDDITVVLAQF